MKINIDNYEKWGFVRNKDRSKPYFFKYYGFDVISNMAYFFEKDTNKVMLLRQSSIENYLDKNLLKNGACFELWFKEYPDNDYYCLDKDKCKFLGMGEPVE